MDQAQPIEHQLNARLLRFRSQAEAEEPHHLIADLIAAGRYGDARGVAVLAQDPEAPDLRLMMLEGQAWCLGGDFSRALALFLRVAECFPAEAEPFLWMGRCLLDRGDPLRAAHALERCLELDDSQAEAKVLLHRALSRIDRIEEDARRARITGAPPLPPPEQGPHVPTSPGIGISAVSADEVASDVPEESFADVMAGTEGDDHPGEPSPDVHAREGRIPHAMESDGKRPEEGSRGVATGAVLVPSLEAGASSAGAIEAPEMASSAGTLAAPVEVPTDDSPAAPLRVDPPSELAPDTRQGGSPLPRTHGASDRGAVDLDASDSCASGAQAAFCRQEPRVDAPLGDGPQAHERTAAEEEASQAPTVRPGPLADDSDLAAAPEATGAEATGAEVVAVDDESTARASLAGPLQVERVAVQRQSASSTPQATRDIDLVTGFGDLAGELPLGAFASGRRPLVSSAPAARVRGAFSARTLPGAPLSSAELDWSVDVDLASLVGMPISALAESSPGGIPGEVGQPSLDDASLDDASLDDASLAQAARESAPSGFGWVFDQAGALSDGSEDEALASGAGLSDEPDADERPDTTRLTLSLDPQVADVRPAGEGRYATMVMTFATMGICAAAGYFAVAQWGSPWVDGGLKRLAVMAGDAQVLVETTAARVFEPPTPSVRNADQGPGAVIANAPAVPVTARQAVGAAGPSVDAEQGREDVEGEGAVAAPPQVAATSEDKLAEPAMVDGVDEDDFPAALASIQAALDRNDLVACRKALERTPRKQRQSVEGRFLEGQVLVREGRAERALEVLKPLRALPTRTPAQLALIGDALHAAGQVNVAAGAYDLALAQQPLSLEALVGRAEVHLRAERAGDAIALLERARAHAAASPAALRARLFTALGHAFMQRDEPGDRELAAGPLRKALSLPNPPVEAHFWLGESQAARRTPEATAAYSRYLEVMPKGRYAERARRALGPLL